MFLWTSSPAPSEALRKCKNLYDIPAELWPALSGGAGFDPAAALPAKRAVIVTNIASGCGLTDRHYTELQQLHDDFSPNLEILGFPSNDFKQESNDHCSLERRRQIKFPIFEMVHVNGQQTHPLFTWCKWKSGVFGGDQSAQSAIGWNFGKFLVSGADGSVTYFGPRTNPSAMKDAIAALVAGNSQ